MSNRIFTDDRAAELVDAIKQQTAVIARGSGSLKPESYSDVQSIVRMGLAEEVFSIGDIIEVARETAIQASMGAHTGITGVTIDGDAFIAAMGEAGEKEYEFVFDGSAWKHEGQAVILADYGLAVTGTPAADDVILVIETASTINMVVMDFIKDGKTDSGNIKLHDNTKKYGMILQSEKILYTLQFDEREAFCYAEEGLSAGTYHFTLGAHTWVEGDVGKIFQFTLTEDVPAGGQLVFVQGYNVTLTGGSIRTFASNASTSVIETVTMSEGSGGTDLGTLNNAINGNLNSCQRALIGSNRWSTGAARQHLNSSASAGSVWTPQTKFDRPPSWANNTAGFMHGLDPEFVKVCADVELITALNTVCDTTTAEGNAGTGYEITTDKYFFPSRPEVFGGKDNNSDIGDPWQYYSANSDLNAAGASEDSNKIKANASGAAAYWWLRSPYVGGGCNVRGVGPTGYILSYGYASNSHGAAPACVIA